jgi:hypothetical protein
MSANVRKLHFGAALASYILLATGLPAPLHRNLEHGFPGVGPSAGPESTPHGSGGHHSSGVPWGSEGASDCPICEHLAAASKAWPLGSSAPPFIDEQTRWLEPSTIILSLTSLIHSPASVRAPPIV